jgi:hypothetical protein
MQPVESTWSKETFSINRIMDNTVGPEILMGRWDTLYYEIFPYPLTNSRVILDQEGSSDIVWDGPYVVVAVLSNGFQAEHHAFRNSQYYVSSSTRAGHPTRAEKER